MKIKRIQDKRRKEVQNVLILILLLNLLVALLKGIFGFLANSISMLSDAAHSLFDGISNIVGIVAIWIASKPPDTDHPYGHRKYESLATIIIAFLILLTCFKILELTIERFYMATIPEITEITVLVMVFTILVNFFVSRYEYKKGKELKNQVLIADSMHTKSDIYVSISILLGFVFIKLGYPVIDPVIALVVAAIIARSGYGIIKRSSETLCDMAMIDTNEIKRVVKRVPGVVGCHKIRTRGSEGDIYVDLHIFVDPDTPVKEGHRVSHEVVSRIKENITGVSDVIVHIEPSN